MNKKLRNRIVKGLVFIGIFTYGYNATKNSGFIRDIKTAIVQGETQQEKYHRGLVLVHEMSNTIITSNNIWGRTKITNENIIKAIDLVSKTDQNLVEKLENWSNGDLSNGVEVHNYVWDRLGGTVGKAEGLNHKEVERTIERLK